MSRILGICGKARSGKTTAVNYVFGAEMVHLQLIKRFDIDDNGGLLVNATFRDENGNPFEEMGLMDLDNKSPEFFDFMETRIYPHIKNYHFADTLKSIAIGMYGLEYEQ